MERLPPGKGGANPAHRPRSTPVIAYACTTSLRAQLQATLVKVASKTAGRCTPLSLPTPDGTRCPEQRSAVVVLVRVPVVQGVAYVLAGILVLILLAGVAVANARTEKEEPIDTCSRQDG